jgi:hypothetical protein
MFRTFYNEFQNVLAVVADNESRPFLLPEPQWSYVGDRTVTSRIGRHLKLAPVYFLTCSSDPHDADHVIGMSPSAGNIRAFGQLQVDTFRRHLHSLLSFGPLWARKPARSAAATDLDPV